MPTYTQTDRPLAITTPLGKDVLLLTAVRGNEAISQLFSLQVDLLAEAQREIRFDRILKFLNLVKEIDCGNTNELRKVDGGLGKSSLFLLTVDSFEIGEQLPFFSAFFLLGSEIEGGATLF